MTLDSNRLHFWRCPHCGQSLVRTEDQKSCYCLGSRKHCFDFAKSGYLNLRATGMGTGDRKEAMRARKNFLDAGYYRPLAERLCAMLREYRVQTVLDAGCGEGYYTNRMAQSLHVYGVDLSKDGIDMAAKEAKRLSLPAEYAVASLFDLPIADASFDAVVNLFAPCAEAEFSRVLKQNGILLVVGAGERHLFGLKQILYAHPYLNAGREDLPKEMQLLHRETLNTSVIVDGADHIEALFSMTPYYWRTSPEDHAKLNGLTSLTTELSFDIFLFRKG